MSQVKMTVNNKKRINKSMRLNKDVWDYYFKLDDIKIRVKDFDLHGKSVSFYFHAGNCHIFKDPLKRCSLYLQDLKDLGNHKCEDKSNPKHCPYVNQLMKEQTVRMFPIYITSVA